MKTKECEHTHTYKNKTREFKDRVFQQFKSIQFNWEDVPYSWLVYVERSLIHLPTFSMI